MYSGLLNRILENFRKNKNAAGWDNYMFSVDRVGWGDIIWAGI